jgi:hypothetical protein
MSVLSYTINSAVWAVAGYGWAMFNYRLRVVERVIAKLLKHHEDDDDENPPSR